MIIKLKIIFIIIITHTSIILINIIITIFKLDKCVMLMTCFIIKIFINITIIPWTSTNTNSQHELCIM